MIFHSFTPIPDKTINDNFQGSCYDKYSSLSQLVNDSMVELLCSHINLGGFQKGRGYL